MLFFLLIFQFRMDGNKLMSALFYALICFSTLITKSVLVHSSSLSTMDSMDSMDSIEPLDTLKSFSTTTSDEQIQSSDKNVVLPPPPLPPSQINDDDTIASLSPILGLLANASLKSNNKNRIKVVDEIIPIEENEDDDDINIGVKSEMFSHGRTLGSISNSDDNVEISDKNIKNKIGKNNGRKNDGQVRKQQQQQQQYKQEQQTCKLSEFRCSNDTCISLSKFCDGLADCSDRSDEPNQCSGE